MKSEFRSRQIDSEHDQSANFIEFILPENAIITLHILDANGSMVEQVVQNVEYAAGIHQIRCENGRAGNERLYYRLAAKSASWEVVDTKMIAPHDAKK
jgi:hypothetical protein